MQPADNGLCHMGDQPAHAQSAGGGGRTELGVVKVQRGDAQLLQLLDGIGGAGVPLIGHLGGQEGHDGLLSGLL